MYRGTKRESMRAIGLTAVAAIATPAFGGKISEDLPEQVVVTATRLATPLREVPASVTIVTAEDMARKGARYIGDELVGVPGLKVTQADEGTYTSLTIRGIKNEHNNDTFTALLDGAPIVTIDDEVDFEQIPYIAIERVEIVRGPMSALYGRGGIAGAVNYVTRTPGDEFTAEVSGTLGSHGFGKGGLLLTAPLSSGRSSLLAGITVERADGWRNDSEREHQTLFLRNRTTLNERTTLDVTFSYLHADQAVAGELPVSDRGTLIAVAGGRAANFNLDDAGYRKNIWMLGAGLTTQINDRLGSTTRAQFRHQSTDSIVGFFNGFDPIARTVSFSGFNGYKDGKTRFAEQQFTWRTGRHAVIAGASFERINAFSGETWTGEFGLDPETFNFYFYDQRRNVDTGEALNREQWQSAVLLDADATARILATYLQYDVRITEQLRLSATARYDDFQREVLYRSEEGNLRKRAQDQHLSPKAAVTYVWSPHLTTYLSFGEGFSPAFGPVWSFNGRPDDLKPEVARNFEFGVKGALPDGSLTAQLAVYRLDRRDLRRRLNLGEGQFRDVNVGRARSDGVELETRYRLDGIASGLSAYLNYAYTDSKWLDNRFDDDFTGLSYDFSGKETEQSPRHTISVGLQRAMTGSGVTLSSWADYFGAYWYDTANTRRGGAYALVNSTISYVPPTRPALSLQLTVRNLLDREFNQFTYFSSTSSGLQFANPGQPRTILGTASFRF